MARVTTVIPNWNGKELLQVVLPGLAAQSYTDARTLVVDNGSTDGSVEYLREHWPDVEVLALPENVGFAPAVNHGIAAARGSEHVALLNNDMELEPDWLGELVAALDAHPRAGSATSKLIDFHDRRLLDGAGDELRWSGVCVRRGQGLPDDGSFDEPREVFSACGGAAIYRRAALEDVGGFDEDFFAYLEDVDWGLRARLRGWGCRYVPTSVAYHMGGATTRRQSDLEVYLNRRNQIALLLKNFPSRVLVVRSLWIVSEQVYALLVAIKERKVGRQLRSWRDAARQLPRTLRKRRAIQRRRTASVAELSAVVARPQLRAMLPGQSRRPD